MRLNTIVRFFTTATLAATILGFSLNAHADESTRKPEIEITTPSPGSVVEIPSRTHGPELEPAKPCGTESAPPVREPERLAPSAPCGNDKVPEFESPKPAPLDATPPAVSPMTVEPTPSAPTTIDLPAPVSTP